MKKPLLYLCLIIFISFHVTIMAFETPGNRIDDALARGELDQQSALLYKVLSVSAPDELPAALKADSSGPTKCSTTIMLEMAAAWPQLSEEIKDILRPHLALPPVSSQVSDNSLKTVQSSLPNSYQTANFNIEWGNTIPSITEWQDNTSSGRPDYIDNLASYLESSWAYEVDTTQLQAPADSSTYLLNVYVANTGDGAPTLSSLYYGYATVFPYDTGLNGPAGMAYLVMNNDYSSGFPSNDDPDGTFLGAMKVTVAHEFFHCIQFGYDINESSWIMELSSTWVEDEVFDQVNDYVNYLTGASGWQMYPHTSLTYFNGMHEYGNAIFGKYLSETYDSTNIMKDLWELLDDVSGDNTINAISSFLANQSPSTTLAAAFNDFTAKNAVMDYDEGASYGGYGTDDKMLHQEAVSSYPAARQLMLKSYSGNLPDYLGSNYIKFTNAGAVNQLRIAFNGEMYFNKRTITWGAAAVAVKTAGGYDVSEFTLDNSGDGAISVADFGDSGTYDKVYLVVRVLSTTGVTPGEDDGVSYGAYPAGVSYSYSAVLGSLTITPLSGSVTVGKTIQLSAAGGTVPYTWETSDHDIATIDSNGLLTGVDDGTFNVLVTDANQDGGVSDTFYVHLPTTSFPDERELPPVKLCFIATAAYGTPFAEEVEVLCEFRDSWLVSNRPGKWFIKQYYHFSPPLANLISDSTGLRAITRTLLKPFVCFAAFLLYAGWFSKTLFALSLSLLLTAILVKSVAE